MYMLEHNNQKQNLERVEWMDGSNPNNCSSFVLYNSQVITTNARLKGMGKWYVAFLYTVK